MFGTILIVFGLLFWFMINRGSGSRGITVSNSGPSDAQVQAGTAVQLAQLGANTQLAMGQLSLAAQSQGIDAQQAIAAMEMQVRLAELAAQNQVANSTIEASLGALTLQLNSNLAITNSNNQFMVDYASVAAESATQQLLIGAALQRDLGEQQLEAFKFSAAAAVIPSLKKGRRDNAFFALEGITDPCLLSGHC